MLADPSHPVSIYLFLSKIYKFRYFCGSSVLTFIFLKIITLIYRMILVILWDPVLRTFHFVIHAFSFHIFSDLDLLLFLEMYIPVNQYVPDLCWYELLAWSYDCRRSLLAQQMSQCWKLPLIMGRHQES